MPDGYLLCDKCGEEIQIVPDFEPEIENSITETLSRRMRRRLQMERVKRLSVRGRGAANRR